MKSKLSIFLLLVAAANPLLAANPCQVECLAPSSGAAEAFPANRHHSAAQEHAHHGQPPSGASVSTSNCGSHAAAALRTPAYLLSAPDRTSQTGVYVAIHVFASTTIARTDHTEFGGIAQIVATFPKAPLPLRI